MNILKRSEMKSLMAGSSGSDCKADDSCDTGCWCDLPATGPGCCWFACCKAADDVEEG